MTGFVRLATALLAAGCLAPGCFAQALVEHAAAAAVGTAGSAGGKALSNALDRIFKQTDAALQGKETKQPPATPEQRKKAEAAAAAAAANSNSAASRTTARRHSRPAIAGSVVSITPLNFEPPFTAVVSSGSRAAAGRHRGSFRQDCSRRHPSGASLQRRTARLPSAHLRRRPRAGNLSLSVPAAPTSAVSASPTAQ